MAADRGFECAQCILLHSVGNRRDQERAVNLLRRLLAIEAAPAVLQLVVASRFQILQLLCEFFGFEVRYHALHSQLLILPIHTHCSIRGGVPVLPPNSPLTSTPVSLRRFPCPIP